MKIVEVISQLSSGGAERFVVDLCNELSINNDVTLIVLRDIKQYGFYASEVSERVNIVSLSINKGFSLSAFIRLRKLLLDIKPDVVHTHLTAAINYCFLCMLTIRKIAFFHTIHSDASKECGNGITKYVRKISFKNKLSTAITVSDESHRSFIEFYGINAPMIFNGRNIPNDFSISYEVKKEFEKYRRDEDTKVLVCLARFDPIKRQTMLAKITKRLNSEGYNNFSILMIGSKRISKIVKEVESYGCDNIFILGEKNNPLEYLKMADAYALCSSYEGMPMSFIEALGVGAVPVCTPVGGIVNVLKTGINGFLSNDLSEESYYDILKEFITSPQEELRAIKIEAKNSYKPFSMSDCAILHTKLFNSLVCNINSSLLN